MEKMMATVAEGCRSSSEKKMGAAAAAVERERRRRAFISGVLRIDQKGKASSHKSTDDVALSLEEEAIFHSPPSPLLFNLATKPKLHHLRSPHHLFRLARGQGSQGIKTPLPPQNPDSVRRFFTQLGFSDSDIRNLVTRRPTILCSSPENTLVPNLTTLRDIGLSTAALTQLVLTAPAAIMFCSAASTVKFWLDFFRGDEVTLVKIFKRNNALAIRDITRVVAPNLSVLRTHGLSATDIHRFVLRAPRIITSRVGRLDDMLGRAKELGFQPGSAKFVDGLQAMHCNSREGLQKKMELFKRFKWSEDEFLAALWKAPLWTTLSEKTLQAKMVFLTGEVGCGPSYVASHPILLTFSLEKRLRPRLSVLRLLESKGCCDEKKGFLTKIGLSNKMFVETYVSPNMEEIPELLEAYHAACAL